MQGPLGRHDDATLTDIYRLFEGWHRGSDRAPEGRSTPE